MSTRKFNSISHAELYPGFQAALSGDADQSIPEIRFDSVMGSSPNPLAFHDSDLEALFQNPLDFDITVPHLGENSASIQASLSSSSRPKAHLSQHETLGARNAKRTRGDNERDDLQICWTSPLFPQPISVAANPHPDLSTCEGACLPHLFSALPNSEPNLGEDAGNSQLQDESQKRQMSFSQPPDSGALPSLKRDESFDSENAPNPGDIHAESGATRKKRHQPRRLAKVKQEAIEFGDASDEIRELSTNSANSRSKGRMPHNQVERKYRESLNTQLEALRAVLPSLHVSPEGCGADPTDMEDFPALSIAGKPSKAVILANAVSYIKKLERERRRERAETDRLKDKVKMMEKLVAVGVNPNGGSCNECQVLGWVRGMKLDEGSADYRLTSM